MIACIQRPPFPSESEDPVGLSGISQPFGRLSQTPGRLSTCYAPVRRSTRIAPFALDLHVLGTPPAFVLSQDQTLQLKFEGLNLASSEVRLRNSRLRCSGHSRSRLTPTLRCRLKELTAVSAIYLLGLAIWFSKTEPLVAAATLCYRLLLGCFPFQLRGCSFYFEALSLSSDRCRFASPLRLVWNQHRARALCSSFRGRRGTYFRFRFRCQLDFVDSVLPAELGSVAVATSPLEGLRLLPPPRQVSTPLVDLYSSSLLRSRAPSPGDFAFPSEGRGFYHRRPQWSQPPSSTLFFPLLARPRRHCDSCRLAGARLLPPPRRESTPNC